VAVRQPKQEFGTRRESSGRVSLGDVITAIDGENVQSPNDLFLVLENHQLGE
jgi:hypothetical protein